MDSITFSFVLPAYKARYLAEAIKSILYQTYQNFELIIVNDASPEDVDGVVRQFEDPRIRYHKNKENIGGKNLVKQWNHCLKFSNSDYIILAADDDLYSPEFLDRVDKLCTKYPKINVVRARCQRIDKNGEIIAQEDIFDEHQTSLEAIHSMFCGNYIGCIGNYVFKTKVLKEKGGFVDFPLAWFSDMATVIDMCDYGQANTCEILFSFRLSDENISSMAHQKETDKKKLEATILFDKWFSKRLVEFKYDKTLLTENIFNQLVSAFKHRIYSQCGDYSWSMPFWYWSRIYNNLKRSPLFYRNSFLKYFGISIINRLFK